MINETDKQTGQDVGFIVVAIPMDDTVQMGLAVGENLDRRLPDVLVPLRRCTDLGAERQVEVTIIHHQLRVRIIGDSRRRALSAIGFGTCRDSLVGASGGPVLAVAQPMGSDAVAKFALTENGIEVPAVHVEWEQAIQVGRLGIDPRRFDQVMQVYIPGMALSREDTVEAVFAEKRCYDQGGAIEHGVRRT